MIIYKVVNWKHDITDSDCPAYFDYRIKKWWKSMMLCGATHAILAFDKKGRKETLIGFFRFIKNKKDLLADGTYVLPAYRSQKIAKKLWHRAIKFAKPNYVEVHTVSKGGAILMASLARKYIKIDWYIYR